MLSPTTKQKLKQDRSEWGIGEEGDAKGRKVTLIGFPRKKVFRASSPFVVLMLYFRVHSNMDHGA